MKLRITLIFGILLASNATPTETPTQTATPTPTVTPIVSGPETLLATLYVDTFEQKWTTQVAHPQIEINNIGPAPAFIKLGASVSADSLTPTPVPDQYMLPAGERLLLGYDTRTFWYKAVTSNATTISVVVRQ